MRFQWTFSYMEAWISSEATAVPLGASSGCSWAETSSIAEFSCAILSASTWRVFCYHNMKNKEISMQIMSKIQKKKKKERREKKLMCRSIIHGFRLDFVKKYDQSRCLSENLLLKAFYIVWQSTDFFAQACTFLDVMLTT